MIRLFASPCYSIKLGFISHNPTSNLFKYSSPCNENVSSRAGIKTGSTKLQGLVLTIDERKMHKTRVSQQTGRWCVTHDILVQGERG
jgi:hypothetical protein